MPTNITIEVHSRGDVTDIVIIGLESDLKLLIPIFLRDWAMQDFTLPTPTTDNRLTVNLINVRPNLGVKRR